MIILYGLTALGVYLIVYGSWLELIDDIEIGDSQLFFINSVEKLIQLNHIRMELK